MRDKILNARIAVIEGTGHEIYVEDPEARMAALRKFLTTLKP
jgi:pimeloyl-ACP methyl ester carboxylesterase